MILNSEYKPKSQKYKLLSNNKLQTTQHYPNANCIIIKNTYVTLYLRVGTNLIHYKFNLNESDFLWVG